MSHNQHPGDDPSDGRSSPASSSRESAHHYTSRHPARPHYMTVGSGSTSASAAALIASLDNDSGYGGSIAGESSYINDGGDRGWHPGLTLDLPTPSHTPTRPGERNAASDQERRVLASHVHQLYYNQNRVALGRAISRTVETLKDLQQLNSKWPAHYPSVQTIPEPTKADPRPGMVHTQSTAGESHRRMDDLKFRPGPRRAATSLGDDSSAEPSNSIMKKPEPPPETLITPQAAHDFSIMKIDLKLQGLTQSEIAHSMDRRAVASLLDGKINQSIRHLLALRERIEDTSSKVLVTGDLNAGKSTFCNALLRRKVLPEDQQPCTSIFCEVLDARENCGLEEVHAVHKDAVYNRNDESTYDAYTLHELENIVTDNDRYTQCKVYVRDIRTIDESLLNNGVVDISIIDAPGLNSDSLKTTAVFARQEEIDVVVFVVSAANHFTLSAKEFIWNAAHEKAYIFIVVNGFDNIRDKQRCQRMVLEQVANLSPRTFKESSELVHFVSSNAIPVAPAGGSGPGGHGDGGGGGGAGSGSGGSAQPGNDDKIFPEDDAEPDSSSDKGKGKAKEREKLQDFEQLESALRRFVLEKRARSKLAPAKTYLMNVLSDLNLLATVNRDVAQSELERVSNELSELEPVYEKSKRARSEVSDDLEKTIESNCAEIYNHTREVLNSTIARVADADLGVSYPGLLNAFQYAEDIKAAMLDEISQAVTLCEEDARFKTVTGVNTIKSLGILHIGNEFSDLTGTFRSDIMFRRKRDILAREVDTPIEIWDFFDVSGLWERQEKVAGSGMALTVVGVLGGRMVGGVGWLDGVLGAAKVMGSGNMRRLIVPGMVAAVVLTTTYILSSIPRTLPPRLSRRLAHTLSTLDYTHRNATRISSEVAKILRYPADNLRVGLQASVECLGAQREDKVKVKRESEVARRYFGNLVRESAEGRRGVEAVDLDGERVPGVAQGEPSGVMV